MKILHWDELFHPDFGYQINVLPKFQALQGHEVIIFAPQNVENHPAIRAFRNESDIELADKEYSEKYNVKIIRLPIKGVVSGRVIYKRGYINKIIEIDPDVILCHTNDTLSAMTIARKYKKINKPMVFDNHMLEMASTNPMRKLFRAYFKMFITPLIVKNKWTVIRTQDDEYVNKCLGIPKSQTPFISFGTDVLLFREDKDVRKKFRLKHNISEDDFVVVYTGKLNPAKGGMLLAELTCRSFNITKNIVFIVVGNTSGEYGEKVERTFNASKYKVLRFPTQKYTDLAQFYQAADLSVFPRQCSLSFYDAQACGLPVVSEDNNVNVDRVQHGNGFNFKSGDVEDFKNKIEMCANMPDNEYKQMSVNAQSFVAKEYDYRNIAQQYTDILEREYEKFANSKK